MGSDNYRKPPAEHRFKKGQSGNPMGRPKKGTLAPPRAYAGGGIADQLEAIALAEAVREIEVREGDKVTKVPAIQALLRSMFRKAAQGDARTQRQLLDLLSRAESGRASAARENLEAAITYKEEMEQLIAERKKAGQPAPEIYPHPDDFVINLASGEVSIDGPLTEEQAGAQEAFRSLAMKKLGRFIEVESALAADPSNAALKKEMKELEIYVNFLQQDARRRARLEALRQSREALKKNKASEPKAGKVRGAKPKDAE